jgi:hypothetical protein
MEVPGRDVTADPLGPDTETPRTDPPQREETVPDETAAPRRDDDEPVTDDRP